ncbi:hypothetical protein ACRE_090660 [Hapsidospora chrysogenum ATCC 11550]|uniref:AB hydrolase-1 domain-containing protein n=1 Tax=Hapsidospora chrysogenum (strain ATCC 11550 / CBS 779.69 / DSM 880 / IAM 14645 / JCM 23072 / IMI 49137) TaxID=857340 RepID=A0A086ST43_HAPC1|nr:hypothetical protein ACRE_090660 [Hapsidospora chrysogenum ATCC 11550]
MPKRHLLPMIGDSTLEWIFIRLAIISFRYSPLFYATGLVIQCLRHGSSAWGFTATRILTGLLVAEAVFYIRIWRPFQARLEIPANHPEPPSNKDRRAMFNECLSNIESLESYLSGWFLGASLDDIRRENLKEFLLWGFFDMDHADVDENDEAIGETNGYISAIEQRLGRSFRDGRGPAKCLRLTLDGAETAYRGLSWYAVVFLADQFTHLFMAWHGFQYHAPSPGARREQLFPPRPQNLTAQRHSPAPGLSYWYQPHDGNADTLPIVFFHGIGIGLLTYARFLAGVHAATKRNGKGVGIIAVEILPISFRLTSPPLDKAEFLCQLTAILDSHGWDRLAVVSHSYGSVLTTHLLHDPAMQRRISSIVLTDPVTIMLHLPQVAYNFTRRGPQGANEWQLWYFASTDPGVAHCLSRHFFWRQNIIWRDQLLDWPADDGAGRGVRRRVAVCLSGRDIIVPTAAVAQYLAAGADNSSASIEVVLFPDLDHAQVFDNPPSFDKLVRLVQAYCATSPETRISTATKE